MDHWGNVEQKVYWETSHQILRFFKISINTTTFETLICICPVYFPSHTEIHTQIPSRYVGPWDFAPLGNFTRYKAGIKLFLNKEVKGEEGLDAPEWVKIWDKRVKRISKPARWCASVESWEYWQDHRGYVVWYSGHHRLVCWWPEVHFCLPHPFLKSLLLVGQIGKLCRSWRFASWVG